MTPTNDKACGEAGQGAKAGTDDERILSSRILVIQEELRLHNLNLAYAVFNRLTASEKQIAMGRFDEFCRWSLAYIIEKKAAILAKRTAHCKRLTADRAAKMAGKDGAK
jgi:hypothetical protein